MKSNRVADLGTFEEAPARKAFTVGQIAQAAGKPARTVRRALEAVEPAGRLVVGGNSADAFTVDQLPDALRGKIEGQRSALNYRTPEAVLTNPKPQWQPLLPLNRQPVEMIESAHKLKRALAYYLRHRNEISLSAGGLLGRAVSDYQAEFQKPVSERHVRDLIERTLVRDGGREELDRLELYLPAKSPIPARNGPRTAAMRVSFHLLDDALASVADLAWMTPAERALVWRAALDEFSELLAMGEKEKPAKRMVLEFLQAHAPRLGDSWNALRMQFDRRLSALREAGIAGLQDKRKENSGRRRKGRENLSADETLLLARANAVGGGISQAFRELYLGIEITPGRRLEFSPEFRAAYSFDPRENKSYVPQRLRDKLRPLLKSIEPLNHGPKTARLAAPSIHRDWSNVLAGAWYQSDDETANHYVWNECDDGEFECEGMRFDVLRPQILPLVDVRTDYVLSVVLLCQPTYNSRAIRTLILRTCMDERVGLPFEGFYFEQGVWKSRNVKAMVNWTEVDEAFSRAGLNLQLRHARTPKAKIIERIFSREQNAMQELPGYAGRDERNDRYEAVQRFIASLKRVGQPRKEEVAPWTGLLSATQYLDHLEQAYERFNHEPQNGKRLGGLSPAEAWEKFSGGRAHHVLPDSLRYLLATETTPKPVKVTREGICLRFGQEARYFFENSRLGLLVGEKVNVRWNADFPDHVVVVHPASDPKGLRPFVVPHEPSLDAMNATKDDLSAVRNRRKVFTQPQRTLFRMLQHGYGRTIRDETLGTPALRQAGEAHRQVEQAAIAAKPAKEAMQAEARKQASRAGLNPAKIKKPERAGELAKWAEIRAKLRSQEDEK